MNSLVLYLYNRLIKPKASTEDEYRKEFILNAILLPSIVLVGWSTFYLTRSKILDGSSFRGASIVFFYILLGVFIGLYFLSRIGFIKSASYILITIYYAGASYAVYHWGTDLPTALLSFGLLIIITSILITTRFSFIVALAATMLLLTLTYLEVNDKIFFSRYWVSDKLYLSDSIQYSAILLIMAVVSWLSNREIERSLQRARVSEAALKKERDSLEENVQERTQDLRQLQLQRVAELHHLAESGKLAAGFFHELMNPLTALTLALEQFSTQTSGEQLHITEQLQKALNASRRVGQFITAIQRQTNIATKPESLRLDLELNYIIKLLDYKARKLNINILTTTSTEGAVLISPATFSRVTQNLIDTALELSQNPGHEKSIHVQLSRTDTTAQLQITYPGTVLPDPNNETGKNMGLLIAYNTLKQIHGSLQISQSVGQHTITVLAEFPVT